MYPILIFTPSWSIKSSTQAVSFEWEQREKKGIEKGLWSIFGLIPGGNKEIIKGKKMSRALAGLTQWIEH